MELILCVSLFAFALVTGAAVIAFQNPARGTFSLLLSSAGAAGAAGVIAGGAVAGAVIWLASTSALLLLYLVLLLNLTEEERGSRRISVRRFGALLVATFAFTSVIAIVMEHAPVAEAPPPVSAAALAVALSGPEGALAVLALAALGLAVLSSLVIARRQP
jgi:hypothetical protein